MADKERLIKEGKMPKIKVSSVKNVKADDFIQVRLKDGEAPKPFNKKAKLVLSIDLI